MHPALTQRDVSRSVGMSHRGSAGSAPGNGNVPLWHGPAPHGSTQACTLVCRLVATEAHAPDGAVGSSSSGTQHGVNIPRPGGSAGPWLTAVPIHAAREALEVLEHSVGCGGGTHSGTHSGGDNGTVLLEAAHALRTLCSDPEFGADLVSCFSRVALWAIGGSGEPGGDGEASAMWAAADGTRMTVCGVYVREGVEGLLRPALQLEVASGSHPMPVTPIASVHNSIVRHRGVVKFQNDGGASAKLPDALNADRASVQQLLASGATHRLAAVTEVRMCTGGRFFTTNQHLHIFKVAGHIRPHAICSHIWHACIFR